MLITHITSLSCKKEEKNKNHCFSDEERSSRPSSRSVREMDRPRSRTEYERDRDVYGQHRDPYRGGTIC